MVRRYRLRNRNNDLSSCHEAVRWADTEECREIMSRWFEQHGDMFFTHGQAAFVDLFGGDDMPTWLYPGTWIVRLGDEWMALTDDVFTAAYEEMSDG